MLDPVLLNLKMLKYDTDRAGCLSFVPNYKQRIFIASRARQKILFGGTRAGKSDAMICDVALQVMGIKGLIYPGFSTDGEGVDAWCSALDTSKWRDTLIPKLRYFLGSFIRKFNSSTGTFETTNGRTITLRTNESGFEKFQSATAPLIAFDEYPPEDIYKECVMRTAERQGTVMVAATPTRGTGWLSERKYDEWFEGTNGELREHKGMIFISLHTEDNKNIPATVVEDIKREYRDPEEQEARLHGKHFVPGGLVFRNFDYSRHVIKPFEIPPHFILLRGMDWGVRSPSTCIWVAFDPDEKIFYVYREFYKKEMGVPRICVEVNSMSGPEEYQHTVLDPSCWNRKGQDAEGAWLDTAQEYIQNGINVTKANNAWSQGVERMIRLLAWAPDKPRLYIFDTCPNLIKEMSKYPWPTHRSDGSGQKLPEKASNHPDHALDGLRYAIMAVPDVTDYSDQASFSPSGPDVPDLSRNLEIGLQKNPDGSLITVLKRVDPFDPGDY